MDADETQMAGSIADIADAAANNASGKSVFYLSCLLTVISVN
ncbi:hypothetical protein SAJA_04100 [Salinisphaera japonica YTM-1]|uniref:Uncharacterized protein n=1 Tax=Salinisphaera japonica YTM-1 TaxID=1209778 RepID=A0A423PZ42_9GAMM|nr:hypothetical protein SAJA_04100 [Salinisphaera japonica YTM-1]